VLRFTAIKDNLRWCPVDKFHHFVPWQPHDVVFYRSPGILEKGESIFRIYLKAHLLEHPHRGIVDLGYIVLR
jgi:hypothetical protein